MNIDNIDTILEKKISKICKMRKNEVRKWIFKALFLICDIDNIDNIDIKKEISKFKKIYGYNKTIAIVLLYSHYLSSVGKKPTLDKLIKMINRVGE